jgi:EAL domain-containing protein (putative c-di-GMP-specific phosphodiesterase class I)
MITEDKKSAVLIESVITIAQKLDMQTIAEGVETADQGIKLVEMGCNYTQGYYYSKPVDYQSAMEIIKTSPFKPIAG